MIFLDWDSDGALAGFALVAYGILFLFLLLPRVKKNQVIARLLPAAAIWHFLVFCFYALWMLPYYAAQSGADCHTYHDRGIEVASLIRAGNWGAIEWGLNTAAMPIITGFFYTPLGGEVYGMLFLSAAIGFCGCLYFCLAFSHWTNPAQTRNYSRIVLFLPSFVLWTGIFGKDSWIALGLGLSAYGYSAKLKGLGTGLFHLLAGMAITMVVRPHIAVAFAVAMVVAYVWGLGKNRKVSFFAKFKMVAMLVGMLVGLAWGAQSFLGIKEVSVDSLEEYGESRGSDNALGGSTVDIQQTHSVAGTLMQFPRGIIRELFEPFPWEVHNFSLAMAALENLFLLVFFITHVQRARRLFREIVRQPYVLFSFVLAVGLMLIFSLTPNLGLLSRQRAQLLPFVFATLVAAEAIRKNRETVIYLTPTSKTEPNKVSAVARPK